MDSAGPRRSWKVLEASERFHKFPDSTIWAPPPLALGGKAPQGGWPKLGGGGALLWEESSLDSNSPVGRTPFGSRSPKGTPTPLGRPRRPLGHLYNVGEGWGAQHIKVPRPMRHPPSSQPRCSTIRPWFRRCSRSESVRVFPSSFLGGVHLWMAECC